MNILIRVDSEDFIRAIYKLDAITNRLKCSKMNIVFVGFSTTGKSSILKEVTGLSENVLLLDSDSEIAKDYNRDAIRLL